MAGQVAVDVTTTSFEQQVIERSYEIPVVVDFWAPWCGPCRSLGPVLERLAGAANDAWQLVKINTDENQDLARRFAIQSIPAVKGFVDGKVVAEFLGAQPEPAVRAFLKQLVPSPADLHAAEGQRHLQAGDRQAAEVSFRAALTEHPEHPAALLGLAEILLDSDSLEDARVLLERIPPAAAEMGRARALLGTIRFRNEAALSLTSAEALHCLEAQPNNPDALYALGVRAAARGDFRAALEQFLTLTEHNRKYGDDAGRKAMLAVFDILGPDQEVTREYRPRLSAALH